MAPAIMMTNMAGPSPASAEIQAARIAIGFQRQESVEQLSLAAARASAQQPREMGRRTDCWQFLFCDHRIGLCAHPTAANADVRPER
jgi:hypothetical protein